VRFKFLQTRWKIEVTSTYFGIMSPLCPLILANRCKQRYSVDIAVILLLVHWRQCLYIVQLCYDEGKCPDILGRVQVVSVIRSSIVLEQKDNLKWVLFPEQITVTTHHIQQPRYIRRRERKRGSNLICSGRRTESRRTICLNWAPEPLCSYGPDMTFAPQSEF